MKKFALMMALALPLAFASCGDDNDETTVTLDQSNVSIDYGKTATLKASEKDVAWGSSNEFVATVDSKGEITAQHAGTTTVTATKNGATARCTVTVVPTNNNFTLPIINWGASISNVKASDAVKDLNLLTETATGLTYTQAGLAYPWYLYVFQNDALAGSMLAVDTDMDENLDLQGFLEQRYALVDEDDMSYTYANANSISNATLTVIYGYDTDLDAVTATWMAPENTKAGSAAYIVRDLKQMLKEAKNK